MVELKIRRFGNRLVVILPPEVIDRLRVKDGETLSLIEAPDGGYRLTSGDPSFEEKLVKAEGIINRYCGTLRELAQ